MFGAKRTIVGVVGDVKDSPTEPATVPALWWPHGQMPFTGMTLVARAGVGDPMSLLGDIRRAVQRLDPDLPLADVHTLDDIAAAANAQRRFVLVLTGLFAAAALLLAAVGAYGVLAWTVRHARASWASAWHSGPTAGACCSWSWDRGSGLLSWG